MTLRLKNFELAIDDAVSESDLLKKVCSRYGLSESDVYGFRIYRKSLDARKKARIVYRYQIDFELTDEVGFLAHFSSDAELVERSKVANPLDGLGRVTPPRLRPVIIGSGPAGTFAALCLAEAGVACHVLERGESVEKRIRTLSKLRRRGEFTPESNYCFGEGGAGTFSDGKLTCGRNHPLVRFLFEQWVKFGAPKDILYEAHPHIGTDYLLKMTVNMRRYLEARGVEFSFGQRVELIEAGGPQSRYRVKTAQGLSIDTDHVILALGHSARDTYQHLVDFGLAMSQKPFAIGARFEHPQEDIDRIQFGSCTTLPAAEYKLATHTESRGIWTFCMCPGGYLLPTSAQPGHLAINGMSYHARRSGYANAAVVVNVLREDFDRGHVLDGMRFQQKMEQAAFAAGGSNYNSPAQKMVDFMHRRESKGDLRSTYKPGVTNARLDQILPEFAVEALSKAVVEYNKKMRGFISDRALVVGVETKTSSPVIMLRDKTLQSVSHQGIFPCGEGAGFAGGIVSAALDGVRVGRALLEALS